MYRLGQSGSSITTTSIGNFAQPVAVAAPLGDPSRLFVVEKAGRVRLRSGAEFLDLTGLVSDTGEQGLLALAVAPDYAASGRVFVFYTDNGGDLQLDEYRRTSASPERSALSTRRPLLTIQHDQADNHNGGQLLFGSDRRLYLSTGDGGTQGDPEGDAQNLGSLLGKILRLDVGVGAAPPVAPGPAPVAAGDTRRPAAPYPRHAASARAAPSRRHRLGPLQRGLPDRRHRHAADRHAALSAAARHPRGPPG